VISRLTSDIDAINELLDTGLDGLVNAALSVASISVILLLLDPPLGIVTLLCFPGLVLLTRWFRVNSSAAYRRTREAVALVIVHFVESLGGIRAVHAFRREPRNQAIFEDVDGQYRKANERSWQLLAIYGPTIKLLGNVTTAVVLFYGGTRAMNGDLTARSDVGRGSIFTLTLPIEAPVVVDGGPSVTPRASMIAVPHDAIPRHRVRM